MRSLPHYLLLILVSLAALSGCGSGDSEEGTFSSPNGDSRIRIAHLAPDGPAVNLFRDDQTLFERAPFGLATAYENIPATSAVFELSSAESFTELSRQGFDTAPDTDYTLFIAGELDNLQVTFIEDDNAAPRIGQARLRAFHGSAEGAIVDVYIVNEETDPESSLPSFKEAEFGVPTKYLQNSSGNYVAILTPTGSSTIISRSENFRIDEGKIYTLALLPGVPDADPFTFLLLEDQP